EDKTVISRYFSAEFFGVDHTIPDTTGVLLKTPAGNIANCADFRINYEASGGPLSLGEFERIGKLGVDVLMLDSTNADEEGRSISEREVEKNIEKLFKSANGRIVLATFSSMLTRIAEILKIAEKVGRHVAVSGFSMKANIQIAQNLGYIKVKKGLIVPLEEIHKYKDDKILVLSTGAQGESNASLMKIVNGENRFVRVKPGDMVIFSSSVIPGNERSVQTLKDNLSRQGAKVFTSKIMDIHSSGHAPQEELKDVMRAMKPKYLVPIHGYYYMRSVTAELGQSLGMKKEQTIVVDNGEVLELGKKGMRVSGERVDTYYVMVDGLGVGDVEEVVLRDRKILSQEGMVVIIMTMAKEGNRMVKNPDIISRGFIYLKENQGMLEEIRKRLRNITSRIPSDRAIDPDYLKGMVRDQIGQYLYTKTKRRPMVLPVIIEI
ncbi:MAG: ribonuclease J, partial [Candidatus Harrisonbacteria bacterium]|nr:ribonuclease J [Candidatus Harrisonbacteria bacterium]